MAYDYVQSLDNVARDRYDAKLQLIGLKECLFRLAGGHENVSVHIHFPHYLD